MKRIPSDLQDHLERISCLDLRRFEDLRRGKNEVLRLLDIYSNDSDAKGEILKTALKVVSYLPIGLDHGDTWIGPDFCKSLYPYFKENEGQSMRIAEAAVSIASAAIVDQSDRTTALLKDASAAVGIDSLMLDKLTGEGKRKDGKPIAVFIRTQRITSRVGDPNFNYAWSLPGQEILFSSEKLNARQFMKEAGLDRDRIDFRAKFVDIAKEALRPTTGPSLERAFHVKVEKVRQAYADLVS